MKLPRRRPQRAEVRGRPGPRIMARPLHEVRPAPRPARPGGGPSVGVAVIALVAVAALVMVALLGLPPSTAQPFTSASAGPSPTPTDAPAIAVDEPARSPADQVSPSSSPTANSSAPLKPPASPASPRQTPRRHPDAAPRSAAEFDLMEQVIAIGFPFKERARYSYRDTFGARREGEAEAYNHARLRRGDRLLRAHDGTDIYAAAGTPVVAPFDGVVIDPSKRWQPWIPERYGRTAVIVSSEPTSEGYTALLSHLEALYVVPGEQVHRGEVVGTVGDTGNAEGGRPHLHFELRAPFLLSWSQVGEDRLIDAFNPYLSLRAADPKRDR